MNILIISKFPIAEGEGVESADSLFEARSLFDFEAVVVDPLLIWPEELREYLSPKPGIYTKLGDESVFAEFSEPMKDRFDEAKHLLSKGGLIVSLLRPAFGPAYESRALSQSPEVTSCYDWIPLPNLPNLVKIGEGIKISRVRSSPFDQYIDLPGNTWHAYLTKDKTAVETLATNDAGFSVASRWKIGRGSVFFMPHGTHREAMKGLISCIKKALGVYEERPPPAWLRVRVPREEMVEKSLQDIDAKARGIQQQKEGLAHQLQELTSIKKLLYEQGEPLTEAVKAALTELGFKVESEGDMDLVSTETDDRIIFEVTGSQKKIDIEKFRQLLDYLMTELEKEGKAPKSILVGNHQMDIQPEKRTEPFTERAVRQATVFGTCLLPTVELYKAVVRHREGQLDAKEFRLSLLKTTGVFKLLPEKVASASFASAIHA